MKRSRMSMDTYVRLCQYGKKITMIYADLSNHFNFCNECVYEESFIICTRYNVRDMCVYLSIYQLHRDNSWTNTGSN